MIINLAISDLLLHEKVAGWRFVDCFFRGKTYTQSGISRMALYI